MVVRIRGFPRPSYRVPTEELAGSGTVLKSKIEMYLPVNDESQQETFDKLFKAFATAFGGATALPAVGGWIMKDGTLATDNISILYSFVGRITPAIKKWLRLEASIVRDMLGEEAITIVYDGVVEFV